MWFCWFLLSSSSLVVAQPLEVRTNSSSIAVQYADHIAQQDFGDILSASDLNAINTFNATLADEAQFGEVSVFGSAAINSSSPDLFYGDSFKINGSGTLAIDKGSVSHLVSGLAWAKHSTLLELHERSRFLITYDLSTSLDVPNERSYPTVRLLFEDMLDPFATHAEIYSNPLVGSATGSIEFDLDPGLYTFNVQGALLLTQMTSSSGTEFVLPEQSSNSFEFDVSLTLFPVPSPAAALPLAIAVGGLAARRRRS